MKKISLAILAVAAGLAVSSCHSGGGYYGSENPGHWYGSGWGSLSSHKKDLFDKGFRQGRRDKISNRSYESNRGNPGIGGDMRSYYRKGYDAGWGSVKSKPSHRPGYKPYPRPYAR